MGRSPCCEKVGLKKGPWTPEEDQKLLSYIEEHGHGSWRALPAKAGLQRCGKSCRLRWTNYLRPDIKRGKFSLQEEQTIIQLHALLGNRWSAIATHLPKRTDNEIKNYWNTHLKKRLTKMGIDPVTHKPKSDALSSPDGPSKSAATLSHMAQWESARLEAEARLARESKLRSSASTAGSSPFLQAHIPTVELHETSMIPDILRPAIGSWPAAKPLRPPNQFGRLIDQDSPTSTLSFSADNLGLMDGLPTINRRAEQDNGTIAGYPLDPVMINVDVPWLLDPLKHAGFGDGFTDMLIENSAEQSSSEGCGTETSKAEGGGEENKSYWNNILNLVNSSSPAGSSPLF